MKAKPLRVALLTQWYLPEPVLQPQWIVRGLQRQGAHVEVLTGVPNYPDGQVHPGYSSWHSSAETIDGVRVQRTPLFADHGTSAMRRLFNYASWAASSALLGGRTLGRADVVLVYSSPATAAFGAMVNRRVRGVPYVLLIQDVWPDSILASGFLPGVVGVLARKLIGGFVTRSYRRAAALIVTSPGMRDLLISRGVPGDKITLAYNWVETKAAETTAGSGFRDNLGLAADDFLVMYAGNHGGAQALDVVVHAFGEIPKDRRCHLVLVGGGIEKPALLRQAEGKEQVHFFGPQPRAVIDELMAAADAQLVSLADQPLFRVTTPSKLQAVLAAGQPIIVHATGDAAQIVRDAGAGIAAPSGDHRALVTAVVDMSVAPHQKRRQWGENGRAYYEEHMAEAVGASRMIDVLRLAARARAARPAPQGLWRKPR